MANPWTLWSQWILAYQEALANLDIEEQHFIQMRARELARQNILNTAGFWAQGTRHTQNMITREKALLELLAAERQLQLLDAPQAFSGLVHTMVQEGALVYQPVAGEPAQPNPAQLPFTLAPPPAPAPAGEQAPNVVPEPAPVPEHVPEGEVDQEDLEEEPDEDPEEDPEEPIFIDLTGESDSDTDGSSAIA